MKATATAMLHRAIQTSDRSVQEEIARLRHARRRPVSGSKVVNECRNVYFDPISCNF